LWRCRKRSHALRAKSPKNNETYCVVCPRMGQTQN
jgi:hypothetical protein